MICSFKRQISCCDHSHQQMYSHINKHTHTHTHTHVHTQHVVVYNQVMLFVGRYIALYFYSLPVSVLRQQTKEYSLYRSDIFIISQSRYCELFTTTLHGLQLRKHRARAAACKHRYIFRQSPNGISAFIRVHFRWRSLGPCIQQNVYKRGRIAKIVCLRPHFKYVRVAFDELTKWNRCYYFPQ